MNFAQIVQEWRKDSTLDVMEIHDEQARSYQIHQKYLEYMLAYRTMVKGLERELATVRKERTDYYTGRAQKPSPVRILKAEAQVYIESDPVYQEVSERLENARTAVYFLERVIKNIEGRTWDIRAAIEWHKMMGGGQR